MKTLHPEAELCDLIALGEIPAEAGQAGLDQLGDRQSLLVRVLLGASSS